MFRQETEVAENIFAKAVTADNVYPHGLRSIIKPAFIFCNVIFEGYARNAYSVQCLSLNASSVNIFSKNQSYELLK